VRTGNVQATLRAGVCGGAGEGSLNMELGSDSFGQQGARYGCEQVIGRMRIVSVRSAGVYTSRTG
jgi:hypothetical protein